jgi:PGF-CTERM protein
VTVNREQILTAGAVGVIAVALLAAVVAPGVLQGPDEEPIRPGPVDIADVTIQPGDVTGETATLQIDTALRHRGNPTPNVTLQLRAIDSESGLLETSKTAAVGELTGETERTVPVNLTVAREGGYRIEVLVYQDGQRVDTGGRTVAGMEALTPAYARSTAQFSELDTLPPIDVSVADAGDQRTELTIATWLTNAGDDQTGDLRVGIVVRQADSNLVAARSEAAVGAIEPGRTSSTEQTVSVPSEYNYYVDAIIWKDDVVVDTARTAVNLDPSERISVNETRREVEFEVSDFEEERDRPPQRTEAATAEEQAPGFGVLIAAVALLVVALVARRWSR